VETVFHARRSQGVLATSATTTAAPPKSCGHQRFGAGGVAEGAAGTVDALPPRAVAGEVAGWPGGSVLFGLGFSDIDTALLSFGAVHRRNVAGDTYSGSAAAVALGPDPVIRL
jgi:hypothetical protein